MSMQSSPTRTTGVLVRNQTLISMITTDPKSTPYFYTKTEAIDIASELH